MSISHLFYLFFYFFIFLLFSYGIFSFLSQVNVIEGKEFDPGTHWDYSSDDEGKDDSGESVYETEGEDDEYSDDE